jgi:aryl-alcohol dehydrogenase-like predicted oxidoreductase
METLDELVKAGKIRAIGGSNWSQRPNHGGNNTRFPTANPL